MSDTEGAWVLVGQVDARVKAIGPYPDADSAREASNMIGMPDVSWIVVPLMRPL